MLSLALMSLFLDGNQLQLHGENFPNCSAAKAWIEYPAECCEIREIEMIQEGAAVNATIYFDNWLLIDMRLFDPGHIANFKICHTDDLDCDGIVGVTDLLILLQSNANVTEVLNLLGSWGDGWVGQFPYEIYWIEGDLYDFNENWLPSQWVNYFN